MYRGRRKIKAIVDIGCIRSLAGVRWADLLVR